MAQSKASKKFMNMAYGLGASIVIIGALFKIIHFEIGPLTGNVMLAIGLITEAIIFLVAGLRGYSTTAEEEEIADSPEAAIADISKEVEALKNSFTGATAQIQNLTGSLESASLAATMIKIPDNFQVNVDELNNRLASASVSVSQVQDVYNSIEKSLEGQPDSHRDVVSASDKLVVQLEEMNTLVKQLNEKYSAIAKAMGK